MKIKRETVLLSFFISLLYNISFGIYVESDVNISIIEKIYIEDPEKIEEIKFVIPFEEHFSTIMWEKCVKCEFYYNKTHIIIKNKGRIKDSNITFTLKGRLLQRAITPHKENIEILDEYLLPTPEIQSNDEKIKSIADKIFSKCNGNIWCFVVESVEWIHKNIVYDLQYADNNYDALWVLDNRKGVCAEYTTLFIALMRSKNIPAKYHSVMAHYKDGVFIPHAYSEIYIDGLWYPVDVLWKQIFYVDAQHIHRAVSKTNKIQSKIYIKYKESKDINRVEWLEEKYEINLNELKKESLFNISIRNKTITIKYNQSKENEIKLLKDTKVKDSCINIIITPCKGAKIYITPNETIVCNKTQIKIFSLEKKNIICNISINYENDVEVFSIINENINFYEIHISSMLNSLIEYFKKLFAFITSLISSS